MSTASSILNDDFMCALLEPLPEGVPLDTQYNALMRRARGTAWRKASVTTSFRYASVKFLQEKSLYVALIERDAAKSQRLQVEGGQAIKLWRQAVADQILTPARSRADVAWKRAAAKDRFLPLSSETIAAAIAADETFFDAHPVNCRKPRNRRPGGTQ